MTSNPNPHASSSNRPNQQTPSEKESGAARKLGGQPESDREAREAGVSSATDPHPREKSRTGFGHGDEVPKDKKAQDSEGRE